MSHDSDNMAPPDGLSLNELIAPVDVETFFDTYLHHKWLHAPGDPERGLRVFSWEGFNRILNMDVWTPNSLQMMMDRQRVPPAVFCDTTVNRNKQQVLRPNAGKVMELLRQGAALVLNEIETLAAGPGAVVETLKQGLRAKASANLYCSYQQRQAFDSHYDRHDVYAVQIYGEKRWRLYRNRADHPVEHPMFLNLPQAEYDRMKGEVEREITMTPGDVLYLPRGTFHDALASSDVSVHVTFSCIEPIGLDWLRDVSERMVGEALFRTEFPRVDGPDADATIAAHLDRLIERLAEVYRSPEGFEAVKEILRGFAPETPAFNLPENDAVARYRVEPGDWKVVRRGKNWILRGGPETIELDDGEQEAVRWIVARSHFALAELRQALPEQNGAAVIDRLQSHNIVEKI